MALSETIKGWQEELIELLAINGQIANKDSIRGNLRAVEAHKKGMAMLKEGLRG